MSYLKGAVIFVCGAAVGAGTSYVYCRKQLDEKKGELQELKDHFLRKIEDEEAKEECNEIIKEQGYISYDTLNDHELSKRVNEVVKKAAKEDRPKDDYPDEPMMIDEKDYSEGELYFDKVELDYYLDDGALVDTVEELQLVENTIGYDMVEKLIDGNEDIIYVRNAKQSTDYLVRKLSGKFSEIVGIGGDEED